MPELGVKINFASYEEIDVFCESVLARDMLAEDTGRSIVKQIQDLVKRSSESGIKPSEQWRKETENTDKEPSDAALRATGGAVVLEGLTATASSFDSPEPKKV